MFTEHELEKPITIPLKVGSVALQLITRLNDCRRLNGDPAINEREFSLIGHIRELLIRSIEETIGEAYETRCKEFEEMRNQQKESNHV